MKKQAFNIKSLLLLSSMVLLFFGFYTPGSAASTPLSLQKGQLPIPGSSETAGFLPLEFHGVLLENQEVKLSWEEDGNLTLRFYDREVIWSSNTSGKGAILYFMGSDGKLLIKDSNNSVVWSAGTTGGQKIELQGNRNLVLASSTNQTVWESGTDITMATEGQRRIGATGHPEDFMVPFSNYKYLTIYTEGADGGKKQVKEAWGATRFTVNGGSGATIVGTYEIGTGDKQIPPGSFLRVFVGKKGPTRTGQTTAGCAGGGGTGVFLKRVDNPEWYLLQVAGGGGGAYSNCCGGKQEGKPAETERNGGKGGGNNGGNGGTNGMNGETKLGGGGGYGTFDSGCMWEGGDSDPTILPGRADGDYSYLDRGSQYPQFGFGPSGSPDIAGSGGGGYSGGGSGTGYQAGGGGGSYLNTEQMTIHNIIKIKNGTTLDTEDGYILYQFSNSLPGNVIYFASNTNKCIDDNQSGTGNGTNIQSYNCNGTNAQKWMINPDDRTIRSFLDFNKCLDLDNSKTDNGSNIQLWDCNGASAQQWVYNGLYKTIHSGVNSDKCFDAANGSATTANVNLQLWDCQYTNANQKWEIDGATTVSNVANKKHIVPVAATGFAVHSHTGAESGSNIQLWTKDNTNTAEQWYFDGLAIKMRDHQNLCVDLNQSSTSNGNNIQLYNCNGTNAQKWIYDGMTKSIRSVVNPDKCMQIKHNGDGVYGKRSNVEIQDCSGSAAQQFLIQE